VDLELPTMWFDESLERCFAPRPSQRQLSRLYQLPGHETILAKGLAPCPTPIQMPNALEIHRIR
jgi:hypothetical protein